MISKACLRLETWSSEQRVLFAEFPVILGRHATANIRLDDPVVADFHCMLDDVDGRPVVRDLNTESGTFVNGVRMKCALLMPGDELKLGGTTFVVDYANEVVETSPLDTRAPLLSGVSSSDSSTRPGGAR